MSSNVTKRTLSAGLGVGALALLAPRASADTPFSSFAFRATGAPTARTLPDRLGELKNVKDFGARGDGSTNDTAAIQAAINQGGTVYFPLGTYITSRSIAVAPGGARIDLVGARGAKVQGAVNGYLFDCPNWDGDGPHHFSVNKLDMVNQSQSPGAGCVRINGGLVTTIEHCYFEAWRPITLLSITCGAVRDCVFRGLSLDGSYDQNGMAEKASFAIYSSTACGEIVNCDFNGYYEAIRLAGFSHIRQNRIEMCTRGMVIGMAEDGNDNPATALIDGAQMEANNIHIVLNDAHDTQIRSVDMLGDPFGPLSDKPNQVGLLIVNPAQNLIMQSVIVEGQFQEAGIKFTQPGADWAKPLMESVWMSTRVVLDTNPTYRAAYPNVVAWKGMEFLDRSRVTFIQCNNP
jgi:hypothetical protein